MANVQEKPRKRLLESDDDETEEQDAFDTDKSNAPRRGRKECRRISGVYREIKSLQQIGQDASVMDLVFAKLPLKEAMAAGATCSRWYIIACLNLRKKYGNSPILRLWDSEFYFQKRHHSHLWINWELHFHEQLLDGTEVDDEPMEGCKSLKNNVPFPSIGTILSIGTRSTFEQFAHEDAKLPIRQDHVYMTCADAIVTLPNYSYSGEMVSLFGLNSLSVQSVFIPKSKHFTINVFGFELLRDEWSINDIKGKVELPVEDIGVGQQLQALLSIQYHHSDTTKLIVDNLKSNFTNVALLAGLAEEIGCNRIAGNENPVICGFSVYTGKGASASVYLIDMEKKNHEDILLKMGKEANSRSHSFCFVFTLDTRAECIEVKDADKSTDEDGDWDDSPPRPPSRTNEIIGDFRTRMPETPIVGINSYPVITAQTVDSSNSNVLGDTFEKGLCYGVLLLSYE